MDATAAGFGGLGTYASGLLGAWTAGYPRDRLRVAVGAGTSLSEELGGANVETTFLNAGPHQPLRRLVQQNILLSRMSSTWQADVFLAMLPQIPLALHTPCVAFVYDLWHEVRPQDFTRTRRLQRRLLYGNAYRRSTALVALSERTRSDLLDAHPDLEAKVTTVHPGSDHVERWSPPKDCLTTPYVIAFGHHRNKRPDLALEAWLQLRSQQERLSLVLCGLDADQIRFFRERAFATGVGSGLTLREYLPDGEFQALLSGAAALMFTSIFEGFGIPVLEAMRLGVPVVVCPDPGLLEAGGNHAFVAAGWTADAVSMATSRALVSSSDQRKAAREHALSFPWSRTASGVRDIARGVANGTP